MTRTAGAFCGAGLVTGVGAGAAAGCTGAGTGLAGAAGLGAAGAAFSCGVGFGSGGITGMGIGIGGGSSSGGARVTWMAGEFTSAIGRSSSNASPIRMAIWNAAEAMTPTDRCLV